MSVKAHVHPNSITDLLREKFDAVTIHTCTDTHPYTRRHIHLQRSDQQMYFYGGEMCSLSLLVALAANLGTLWQWWSNPSQTECIKELRAGRGRGWRQNDPYPEERDSFHYLATEKEKGGERERKKRRSRLDVHFITAAQSRDLSPSWQIATGTASDVHCEAAGRTAGHGPLIMSKTYLDLLFSLQFSDHSCTHAQACSLRHLQSPKL